MLEKHLGIRFVYEEQDPSQARQTALLNSEILAAEIVNIPSEGVQELAQATKQLDIQLMLRIIHNIREEHPSVAKMLEQMAENFEYEKILAAIET